MDVEALRDHDVPGFVIEQFQDKGITTLNPPQAEAVDSGLLEGESLIVSSPTASGKTLIATLAIANLVQDAKKKAIYLVPLKALGSEKYRDYTDFFEGHADVGLSIGDRDSSDRWVETKDLIVMTVEKLDAVMRHNPSWINDIGLVVVDEIHLLNDPSRGPTLEVTLTQLRERLDFQLLGLSATINNSEALADWLDCGLVESDYRPVTLKEGLYHDNEVTFYTEEQRALKTDTNTPSAFKTGAEKKAEEEAEKALTEQAETVAIRDAHGRPAQNLLDDALQDGKQAITFVRSRKSAESEAERNGKVAQDFLTREERQHLDELSDDIEHVLGSPTKQCRRLARCVADGAAFHHAGLLSRQRQLIEDAFRDGVLKSVSATPTLAAGVSLPAYRIVIRDVQRYTDNGLQYIPVLEYKQMAGRAGRPEHHDEGQAIVVAKKPGEVDELRDRYVLGDTENIYSKLAVEPVLRMHALGLIATRFTPTLEDLLSFFNKTFYAHQYGDEQSLKSKVVNVVETLDEYGFVAGDEESLQPTKLGKRVAELYIDPYTAHHLLEGMERARGTEVPTMAYLHLMCETVEMKPRLRVRNKEMVDVEDALATIEDKLLGDVPKPWDDYEYRRFLESLKTSMMLQAWIQEVEEDDMMNQFSVTPGGIRAKVERADWLLYACTELCTLKEWDDVRRDMQKLRTRMKHGIQEELLPLVRFKGIGRVRARRLHDRDIKTAKDIREVGFTRLKNLIGKKTAEKLKEQVGQDEVFDKENILDYFND